jgi:hypothetical protein
MASSDTDSKVSAWWPVLLALLLAVAAFATLEQRVTANEGDISDLKQDHDKLNRLYQRVEDIADYLGAPKRHLNDQ